jgi:16S rRNA (cytosine1402-N4)-methyltransferase
MDKFEHISVLREELVSSLNLKDGDIAIDCTAGGGGHTALLLDLVGISGKVLAFDRDDWAQATLKKRFLSALESGQLELIKAPFSKLLAELESRQLLGKIQGLCADVGVSSPQIDEGERGFSFAKPGPLDMRMDQSQGITAADLVNESSEDELTNILNKLQIQVSDTNKELQVLVQNIIKCSKVNEGLTKKNEHLNHLLNYFELLYLMNKL